MRPAGDEGDEMTDDCFDDAFDRYLAGRPVPAQAAALVAFADDVRAVAACPGRPSPQLARMLADGLGSPDAAAVGAVPPPRTAGRGGHRRRKRTVFEALSAAAARAMPAGAFAQAALGLGVVLAGVTGAGAAGVLPGPVQDEVSSVVEVLTPFELPTSADDTSTGDDDESSPPVGVVSGTGEPQDGELPPGTPAQAEFGARVSGDARDDGVVGQDISDQARGNRGPGAPADPGHHQPATERPAPAHPDQDGTGRPATSPGRP
jgi:hypothetical protein